MHLHSKVLPPLSFVALGIISAFGLLAQAPPAKVDESSKPAEGTLRAIAQRITACPKALDFENRWGKKPDEIQRLYFQPPVNVIWNVVLGNSVRAPYLSSVEFTVEEVNWVPDSARDKFSKSGAWMAEAALENTGALIWHFRYEYDLGPDGLQLTRALWRHKSTDAWKDSDARSFAKHCWDAAARNTQAQAASVPEPSTSGSHLQVDVVPLSGNIELIKEKATNGEANAERQLGYAYESGQEVPQDYAQSVLWYRKAANQGDAYAQYDLGRMYLKGEGLPQDDAQAAFWFRKAADQGNTLAQLGLGFAYELGHGVPKDYVEAYFWLDLAAAGNLDSVKRHGIDVAKLRDEAASHLTPSDLARTQERARKWFEDHPAKP
jgi:TPR repeat protein